MKYLLLVFIPVVLISCQKGLEYDTPGNPVSAINCDSLQQGLIANDVSIVRLSLGNLLNTDYSEDNLKKLADTISTSCDIKAELTCFECIETLPAQSDMTLTFFYNGNSITKELDFTYGVNEKPVILINVQ